tara:strand:+ start:76 stop:915 length:840 start_codon:yes stop_codon:yes gene_type:complete
MTEDVLSKEQKTGPYRGGYKEGVYAEETEMKATQEETQETSQDDEETISLKTEIKTEEHDYKKRYDDLKKHYDSKLHEWREEREALIVEGQSAPQISEEDADLESFKESYPDVYNAVATLSAKKSSEEVQELRGEIERLTKREEHLKVKSAYQELLALHPDFAEIKKSDQFKEWIDKQPPSIADGITNNNEDVQWASRVLDLYKADTGTKKKVGRPKKQDLSKAAEAITTTSPVNIASNSNKNKRVWTTSEIRKLKPHEFDKLESEIDQANAEGRIVNG